MWHRCLRQALLKMASRSHRNRRSRDFGWLLLFAVSLIQALALGLALLAAGCFAWVVARRIAYPYDLEWMEGSMLHHALRIASGLPIYTPPSIDFVPHLYTPLYPWVVAFLGKLCGGVGYLVGRMVSLVAFLGALGIGGYCAWREGGSRLAALVALALPVAAFADTGGFYDLVRCDSLQLFFAIAGAALAIYGRARHLTMVGAALLFVAAFFAKQTAGPLAVSVGLFLLLLARKHKPVWTFAAAGAITIAVLMYVQNRASDGWFFTYIFHLHQNHAFFSRRAWIETPLRLLVLLGPALLLVPWALLAQALGRSSEPALGLGYWSWLGLSGFTTACLSFGTQWAHINAFIPGIFFPSIAIGIAAGRLLRRSESPRTQSFMQRHGSRSGRALRQGLVWLLLGLSLGPRVLAWHPTAHIPTAADRQAGDSVIARLASAPGDVLIPFHPFYAHLAGKRVFLHRMGIWDVRGTKAGPVHGLEAAFAQQRFSRIIFDKKVEATWSDWPEVLSHYRIVERFIGPRVVEGADTRPELVLEPVPPTDHELQ